MLLGIQLETQLEILEFKGSGALTHTITCRESSGDLVALKVSRTSRPENRMHNDPVVREAANLMVWHQRTHCYPIQQLLPAPQFLMADRNSIPPFTAGILLLGNGRNLTHSVCHTRLDPALVSAKWLRGYLVLLFSGKLQNCLTILSFVVNIVFIVLLGMYGVQYCIYCTQ
jgi:hypothetical protein